MRQRPSARLLVVDSEERVLLFRFAAKTGPHSEQTFWATPGGGLDSGETYAEAARRELFEETGLRADDVGPEVARRVASFQTLEGDWVQADERFFVVRVSKLTISRDAWTELEHDVMAEHRWWSLTDLRLTSDQVWPEDIADMLIATGVLARAD